MVALTRMSGFRVDLIHYVGNLQSCNYARSLVLWPALRALVRIPIDDDAPIREKLFEGFLATQREYGCPSFLVKNPFCFCLFCVEM